MEECAGRGSFDRGDLKEAAGGASRAMEPQACFWGFGAGRAGNCGANERPGRLLLKRVKRPGCAGKVSPDEWERRWSGTRSPQGHGCARARGHVIGSRLCHDLRAVQRPAPGGQLARRRDLVRSAFLHCSEDIARWRPRQDWWRQASAGSGATARSSREREPGGPMRVRQKSELPDADEASRQNVLGKTA